MKLKLLLSLLFIVNFGQAQTPYNRQLIQTSPVGFSADVSSISLTLDGGYDMMGFSINLNAGILKSKKLFKIDVDSLGTIQNTISLTVPQNTDFYNSVLEKTGDGGVVFSTRVPDISGTFSRRLICRLDSLGQTIWSKVFVDSMNHFYHRCLEQIINQDTLYHFFGNAWNFPGSMGKQPAVFSVNSQGNFIGAKYFGQSNFNDFFSCISKTNDNGYLMLTRNSAFSSQTIRTFAAFKFDSSLQLQWVKKYQPDPSNTYNPLEIHPIGNQGFLYIVAMNSTAGSGTIILKVDNSGNILSTKFYPLINLRKDAIFRQDSSMLIPGTTNASGVAPVLFKMDTTGLIQQMIKYNIDSTGYLTGRVVPSSIDSGILIWGGRTFLRLNGQLTGACGDSLLQTIAPVSALMQVSVYTPTNVVPVSFIQYDSVFVQPDTITLHLLNACNSTVVLSDPETDFKNDFRLFPNPCDQSVSIHMDQEKSLSGFYQIYDLTGRIFHVGELAGKTTTISIEDLKEGVYWVRLFSKDRSSCKKLMVNHSKQ